MKFLYGCVYLVLIFTKLGISSAHASFTFDVVAPREIDLNIAAPAIFSTQLWEWIVSTSGTITQDTFRNDFSLDGDFSEESISTSYYYVDNAHLYTPLSTGAVAGARLLSDVYGDLLLASEVEPTAFFDFAGVTQIGFNTRNYQGSIGSESFSSHVRIGDQIAKYTVQVNIINDPEKGLLTILEGQRVSSTVVPVPSSGIFFVSGVFTLFAHRLLRVNKANQNALRAGRANARPCLRR